MGRAYSSSSYSFVLALTLRPFACPVSRIVAKRKRTVTLELLHLLDHPLQQQQKFFVILHHIATLHIQVIDRSRLAQALHTLPQFLQLHWYYHLL